LFLLVKIKLTSKPNTTNILPDKCAITPNTIRIGHSDIVAAPENYGLYE